MFVKLTAKDLKVLLIGFLLGMISVLALMKIIDSANHVEYVPVSLDELEQNPEDSQTIQETATQSVDKTDLESF